MRDVNKYIDYDMYMMLLLLCGRRLFNNFQIFAEFFSGGHAERSSRRRDGKFRTEQQFSWLKMILAEDF